MLNGETRKMTITPYEFDASPDHIVDPIDRLID